MRLTSYLLLSLSWVFVFAVILLPLFNIFGYWSDLSFGQFCNRLFDTRLLHAIKLTLYVAVLATLINMFFGLIISIVLSKYDFIGKSFVNMCINIPLCLPTAVSGIALSYLYAKSGYFGQFFDYFGIKVAYTDKGILLAMMFVSMPFIVRSIQPVIDSVYRYEEAAKILGAYDLKIFISIILPNICHAMISGGIFAFARCIGEYGAVVFVAGNIPYVSESISVVMFSMLEQYDYIGISIMSGVMIMLSFLLLLLVAYTLKSSDRILNT